MAAVVASAFSLALIGAVVLIGPLRNVRGVTVAAARPTPTGYPRISPIGNPASSPYSNPASGPYPPYGNPASGPYPPQGNPASPSGSYPPFYPPASSGGSVATLALNCRLPVYAGQPGSGGFIVFPGGTFIADPTSSVTLPSPSSGATAPPGGPGYGPGYPGLSYDRAYSRWLPVPINWVSPDGKHYAYTLPDGIYAATVATGAQAQLREGRTWSIVGVQNDGVYAGDSSTGGLWVLPFSGTPRQITTTGYWQAATSVAAFGTATSAVPQGASNSILRLDLKTGQTAEWFSHPDTQSSIAGFDGKGNPVINVRYVNNSGNEIWIASGPTSAAPIAGVSTGYYQGGFSSYATPVADSHGLWFAGGWSGYGNNATGVALYVAGSGLYWMSSIGGQLAGGCY